MDMTEMKRKRWNLLGFLATIAVTLLMLCLIWYGHDHKEQLEYVLSVLTVILIVAIFAIIRRNVKQMCKNKMK